MIALVMLIFALDAGGFVEGLESAPVPPLAIAAITFILMALFFGGNEEIGWRGTMQLVLEKRFAFPVATLIVGAVWMCWHLPLWFIPGDLHLARRFCCSQFKVS